MGFKLFFRKGKKIKENRGKNDINILEMLKDNKEYHYITEIIKEAEKEIERFLPTRVDDLYDYVDYEDIKKVAFLINKKGFKLSEKDLERFFTEELERLAYKKFKEWVELRNPKNEIDIIKLFLKYDIELRDEIEEIIDDVDEDIDEYIDEAYLESIIGSRLKYLIKILQDHNIELSKKEIYNKIEEIIEKERLKKFEDELKSQYLKKSINTSKENDLLIRWEDIIKMNGYDFESFIENLFRSLGFNVEKTSYSKDQGADLIISKGSLKIAIQVKRYDKRNRVGNRAVQEIAAAMNYYKADKGMVITTSEFTQSAIELANANGIKLISGRELKKIIDSLNTIYHILLS